MSKTTAGYLTGMTTNARTPLMLAAMVALRVDNMGDTCPAWIASAERRCGKPATDGHDAAPGARRGLDAMPKEKS